MPKYSNATGKGRSQKRKAPLSREENEKTHAGKTGGKHSQGVRGRAKREGKLQKRLVAAATRNSDGPPAQRLLLAHKKRATATHQRDLDKVKRTLHIILVDAEEGTDTWTDAGAFLATLLLESRRADGSVKNDGRVDGKVLRLLEERGFRFRLSHPALTLSHETPGSPPRATAGAWDAALSPRLLEHLTNALAPNALFWRRHEYSDGSAGVPASPHFSYVVPLDGSNSGSGNDVEGSDTPTTETALVRIIRTIQSLLAKDFPEVMNCAAAEWSARCRHHCSGQTLHFDSSSGDGGGGGPVAKAVLCLSEKSTVGGETLVTSQKATDAGIAAEGWLCAGRRNRLLGFDGALLHGVVPGHGADVPHKRERRVTFVVSFWKSLRAQEGEGPGPARAFATAEKEEWAQTLVQEALPLDLEDEAVAEARVAKDCFFKVPVWEDVDAVNSEALGNSLAQITVKEDGEMPPYDSFFQFYS